MTPDIFDLGLSLRAAQEGHPLSRTAGSPWPRPNLPTITVAPTGRRTIAVAHGGTTVTGSITDLCTLLAQVASPTPNNTPYLLITTTAPYITTLAAIAHTAWADPSTPPPHRWMAALVARWHHESLLATSALVSPVLDRLAFRWVQAPTPTSAVTDPLTTWARSFNLPANDRLANLDALHDHATSGAPLMVSSERFSTIDPDHAIWPAATSLPIRAKILTASEQAAATFNAWLDRDPRWTSRQMFSGAALVGTITRSLPAKTPAIAPNRAPSADPTPIEVRAHGVLFSRFEPNDPVTVRIAPRDDPSAELRHTATITAIDVDEATCTVTLALRLAGSRPTIDATGLSKPQAAGRRRAIRATTSQLIDAQFANRPGTRVLITPAPVSPSISRSVARRQRANLAKPAIVLDHRCTPARRATRAVPPAIIAAAATCQPPSA